jgi:hypothetical protein
MKTKRKSRAQEKKEEEKEFQCLQQAKFNELRQIMSNIQSEEYKFLRQEHENNRKFIFERPLLIVGATFASAITINDKSLLLLLPLPFLALLYFNIWFTHNRMESSARIVSYLQIVHEGVSKYKWIGWENAVRLYRKWIYVSRKNKNELQIGRAHV